DTSSAAVVLFTSDGGESWSERYRSPDRDGWCWKISFPNRDTGYVSIETEEGKKAFFLKTTNRGQTWTRKFIPQNFDFEGIGFITPELGWAGGWAFGIYTTTDGGDTWTKSSECNWANRFRFFGDTIGY